MKGNHFVIIKGAGDIASGIAHKLFRCGYAVVMTEMENPTCVRRNVSFASCIYEDTWEIEGVQARKAHSKNELLEIVQKGLIPVLVDTSCRIKDEIQCKVLIDATLAKRNTGTYKGDAPLVIGLGPGFEAGRDVDVVIETNRGHDLGRIIWKGKAEANTGIPGNIAGYSKERVLRAPVEGIIRNCRRIGDQVQPSDTIARIDHLDIRTPIGGVIRGLIYDGLKVYEGCKIGDVDSRPEAIHWINTISDKARCIAGGVVEAIRIMELEEENGAKG